MAQNLARSVAAGALLAVAIAIPIGAEEMPPDPSAAAAEAARQAAAGQLQPRFVPGPDGAWAPCQNEPPADQQVAATIPPGYTPRPGMNGGPGWQVSAPRGWPGPTQPGGVAELSLRDKVGTGNRLVYADVVGPDGTSARAGQMLLGSRPAPLTYPTDFRAAPPLVAGAYTVIWRATVDDRFIACDGFVVTL